MIDVFTKNIRVELVLQRNTEIIKKLVLHHIGSNNTIITDGWDSYNWLSSSNYCHIVHVHGRNDFGFRTHSTCHIESIWGYFKGIITRIYCTLLPDNFIYYLKEIEFRYNIRHKTNEEKLNDFKYILDYVYTTSEFNFINKDDLIDFNKNNYCEAEDSEVDEEDDD